MIQHETPEPGLRHRATVRLGAAVALATMVSALVVPSATVSAAEEAAGTGTLSVLVPASGLQAGFEAVAQDFEAEYPTLTIEFQGVPSGATYGQVLLTQLQSGTAPDVFYTNGGRGTPEAILPLAEAGRLADLSDRSWAQEVPEAASDLYWSGESLYGLPLYLNPLGVVYNVDEFESMGLTPPATFDEMLSLCGTVSEAGVVPIAIPGQFPRLLGQILAANYVYASDPSWDAQRTAGEVTFADTPGWADTIQAVIDMNDAGCFPPGVQSVGVPQSFSMIGSGQALMYAGPASGMGGILSVDPELNLAMFALPGPTADATRVMAGYFDALAVNADSGMLADAQLFADFFARPEQQAIFAAAAGGIAIADAAAGELPAQFAMLEPYLAAGSVVSRAQDAWPGAQVVTALDDALVGAITGQLSVDDGLARLDAAWAEAASSQ